MTCADRYDLKITDAYGESHGLICDWSKSGAGLTIEKSATLESTRLASKGEYGVKDVNDYVRIIQTDWSTGCGQETYDREADSESAFLSSWGIDTSRVGSIRLGPHVSEHALTSMTGPIIHGGGSESWGPILWAACSDSSVAQNRLRYSVDGATWLSITDASDPAGTPTSLAHDGQHLFIAAGGKAYAVTTAAGGATAVSAADSDITHVAVAAGVLYGAKGSDSVAAQVGYYSALTSATWTAITPLAAEAIGAVGHTFGLVSLGSYVYWGVTGAMYTKVYKVRRGTNDDPQTIADTMEEVAIFPAGFVGSCMCAYVDTVYIGGGFGTSGGGHGAIYALIDDTPALLTNVGADATHDNRVLAMTGWERSLYFVSDSQIWRWDIVSGGYSHHAGPLDSTAVMSYDGIWWDGEWTCNVIPGFGSEPDADVTTVGTATAVSNGTSLLIKMHSPNASRTYTAVDAVAGIDDSVGTTLEMDVPANCIYDNSAKLSVGIRGSSKKAHITLSYAFIPGLKLLCRLYSGTTLLSQAYTDPYSAHTFRLTLKNGRAEVYIDGGKCMSNPATAANTTKAIWLQGASETFFSSTETKVIVSDVRWSSEGAYDSTASTMTPVTGVGLAAMNGNIYAACSGVGCTKAWGGYFTTAGSGSSVEQAPFMMSSRSAANMPTVDKFFYGLVVNLQNVIPTGCDVKAAFVIDGYESGAVSYDTEWSSDTELFFPIEAVGKNISWALFPTSTDTSLTPVISEVAVLCKPVPKTTRVYSYFVRCWERVEDRIGGEWDENPDIVRTWLEETANTVVEVERPDGSSYVGTIEELEMLEAAPSQKANGREGLLKVMIRRLA